jgi:hypothetical protein
MGSGVVQFGRAASLIVSTGPTSTQGLVLSQLSADTPEGLRFKFEIEANDVETPNTARIRVYNLSADTVNLVRQEYSFVILNAGYGGNMGQIFQGTIKQFRVGKERNVDSFLDIFAADGDIAYNFAIVNASLKDGSTPADELQQYVQAFQAASPQQNISQDPNALAYLTESYIPPGAVNPGGKVAFGLARDYMRDLANSGNVRWSIQNGVVTIIPITGYLPGEAIAINSLTGMVGVPEATEEGLIVECLLNPLIKVGAAIQLNNNDITTTQIREQLFPSINSLNFVAKVAPTANDGYYRVLVAEHRGDTRDLDWYTKLTCLLIDDYKGPGGAASGAVAPFGIPPS